MLKRFSFCLLSRAINLKIALVVIFSIPLVVGQDRPADPAEAAQGGESPTDKPIATIQAAAVELPGLATSADESRDDDNSGMIAPLRGLLITGGCCHDYLRQTTIITRGLSERINIRWTVVEYGTDRNTKVSLYNQPKWADEYDIVLHNECFGGVDDAPFVDRIVEEHVRSQVPAVMVHCSMHSYRLAETDRWRQLVGMTSRRHEKAKRSLEVMPSKDVHPIMVGFPERWNTPNGELYIIEKVWPTAKVLATAYSTEEKKTQPVIWVNEIEGVRVFGTTLGHHNETQMAPEWLDTVSRGTLWACGKLNEDGTAQEGFSGSLLGSGSVLGGGPTPDSAAEKRDPGTPIPIPDPNAN